MKKLLSPVFVKIVGILFVLVGVALIGNVVYSVTIADDITASKQLAASQKFAEKLKTSVPMTTAKLNLPVEPPIVAIPAYGESFAILHVPRFGKDYSRVIAEGVNQDVLDSPESGVGHVPKTQALGELGNFAIAGHRKNNGGTFRDIDKLQVNDVISIETKAGSYYYHFTSQEIVKPTQVEVLLPVPNQTDAIATERVITIISCYPLYSSAERIIAHGVFDKFVPRHSSQTK